MKTLNNYIMASSIIALSDSLVTGQKFGLVKFPPFPCDLSLTLVASQDPQKMIDVLNVGTGRIRSSFDHTGTLD